MPLGLRLLEFEMEQHKRGRSAFDARWEAVAKWGFAVPNDKAIATCLQHSPLVEMGAGLGYWAKLIEDAGGDVICYDKYPPGEDSKNHWWSHVDKDIFRGHPFSAPHHEIRRGTPPVLRDHSDRTLLLIWPYMDRMASGCLKYYRGDTLIFVGEGQGGACANDKFFDQLEKEWERTELVSIPQWYGLHDYMEVFRRIP